MYKGMFLDFLIQQVPQTSYHTCVPEEMYINSHFGKNLELNDNLQFYKQIYNFVIITVTWLFIKNFNFMMKADLTKLINGSEKSM